MSECLKKFQPARIFKVERNLSVCLSYGKIFASELYSLLPIDIRESADDFESKINSFSVDFIARHFSRH